ncbi:MAG: hypothetical protein L3J20_14005 [Flavobacteriaceae bacterium]|nr:hypothetical protein [Flavobacteriaceae bacterium]
MKEEKINTDKLHLFHIDLIESSIKDLPQKGKISFNIKVAHKTMHNLEDERIKIGLLIDLETDKTTDENANAHFNFDFHFQIDELKKHFKLNEKENPVFSGLLIATLLGLSFSTARGIIYERLSNTNLQGIILPIVSPQKMLSQQMENADEKNI